MSIRRSIIVLIIITLALPAVFFAVRANRAASQDAPASQLQLYTVGRGDVELTVSAIGQIEADQETRLSFNGAGRIIELPVQVGDNVMIGTLLVRLDDSNQRVALEQAQLNMDMATLQRDQLLAGPNEAQIASAQAGVDAAQGAAYAASSTVSDADIQSAQLAYDAALQAVSDAQLARSSAPGGQPQAYYDLLDAQIGQATFNAEIARLQLQSLQNGNPAQVGSAFAQADQAQAQLDQLLAGPTQAQIDQADAAIAQAQIQLDAAQRDLERRQLSAPFDGVVTAVSAEIGSLTAPAVPVITLTDMTPLRLTVQVDEIDVREITEGMAARIRLDALPGITLNGTLEQIAVISTDQDGIVNYDVLVRLDETHPDVRVGMTAEAAFISQSVQDVLIVPNQYIRLVRNNDSAYVNLLQPDGSLLEVEVTLGFQGRDTSQILSGVSEGDVIAVDLAGDSLSLFGG
jgi:HlyD family secretion protein